MRLRFPTSIAPIASRGEALPWWERVRNLNIKNHFEPLARPPRNPTTAYRQRASVHQTVLTNEIAMIQ
jgi:hypothetical protein